MINIDLDESIKSRDEHKMLEIVWHKRAMIEGVSKNVIKFKVVVFILVELLSNDNKDIHIFKLGS